VFSQNEASFDDLLSTCKKAKTETEDNVRSIKQFWKADDVKYYEATRLYNNARAEFEGWIDFYKLETTDAIINKKYVVDEQKIRSKINDALNAVNKFNSYYYNAGNSNSSIAVNSGVPPIINISSCFDSANTSALQKKKSRMP
jgi:NurA-like 5'-3' nuclease